MKKLFIYFFLFLIFLSKSATSAWAITYDLIAPSGTLSRGQEIKFTINIDTEGTTVSTTQIGMSYETVPLQYVGTTAGDAMTSISVEQQTTGKFLLTGVNQAGFSGKGTFAYVSFKIIAESSGSTQLCALWAPAPTATTAPTAPPGATSTPQPATQPTSPPPPKTGSTTGVIKTILLGIVFIGGYLALYHYKNNLTYDKKIVKKITHKKK